MRAHENPFRCELIEGIPFVFDRDDWTSILSRLQTLGFRAAIVGPHGSGKTTFLLELVAHLRTLGLNPHHIFLNDRCGALAALPRMTQTDVLLVDGADHLPALKWQLLKRRVHRLIITSHRPGRLPTLLQTRTSPMLLQSLVAHLLPRTTSLDFDTLHSTHKGNIRAAFSHLYDRFADDQLSQA